MVEEVVSDGDREAEADLHIPTYQWPPDLSWWLLTIGLLFGGSIVIGFMEPAGFDRCDAVPGPTAQAAQVIVACGSVLGAVSIAKWRLRRWWLVSVLLLATLTAAAWSILLREAQNC